LKARRADPITATACSTIKGNIGRSGKIYHINSQ
jgi:hypothetical protein